LQESPEDKLPPIWLVDEEEFFSGRYRLPAVWTRFAHAPGFLENLTYYCDGLDYPFHGMPKEPMPLAPPYDAGYTQAIYHVSETLSEDGLRLPKTFSLSLFAPKASGRNTNDLRCLARWSGRVEHAQPGPVDLRSGSLVSAASDTILVIDKRFTQTLTNLKSLNYFTTNRWPETNDPVLVGHLAASVNMKPAPNPEPRPPRVVLWAMLLVLLAPLLGSFARSLRYNQKIKEIQK
jgi:hypothetical protein